MDIEEQNELDMFEEVGENWDESDIRSLIAHVKANQFLVNKTETDFKNKEKKDDAWKIIAMLLNKSGMFFMYRLYVKLVITFNL